jgi:uncharacterized protein (DUF2384 family)
VPEAAAILHIPTRAMTRRRQARKLDPDESDRLYQKQTLEKRILGAHSLEKRILVEQISSLHQSA